MYAVVRKYRASNTAEISRLVRDEFIPRVSEISGFIAYYVLDGGDGTIASVTVCDDQAGADESTRRAGEWVGERLSGLIEGPPDVTAGEVTVSYP